MGSLSPLKKWKSNLTFFWRGFFLSDTHAVATLLLLMLTGWSLFSNNHLPCLISIQRGYMYNFEKKPSICTRLSPCKYKVTSETYCFNIKCLLSYQPLVVVVEKTYALSVLSICLACHKIYTDLIQKRRRKIFYFWKEPVLLSDNLIQV